MVKRRIGAPSLVGGEGISQYGNPEDIQGLLQLASMGSLANNEPEPILDLMGTSQEPRDYSQVEPAPDFKDVRQNQVMEPAQPDIPGLSNLPANINPGFDVNAQGLPQTPQGKLQDPLEFIKSRVAEDPSLEGMLPEETRRKMKEPSQDDMVQNFRRIANLPSILSDDSSLRQDALENLEDYDPAPPSLPPTQTQPTQPQINEPAKIVPPEQEITEKHIDDYSDKGFQANAVEEGVQDPQIMADMARFNGYKEIPKEYLDGAKLAQDAFTKRREELNAEEASLVKRAESGELTTMDKVFMGIAIAIPILIALRYGTKAGIAAAGGGLQGFGKSMMEQEKLQGERDIDRSKRLKDVRDKQLDLETKAVDIDKKQLDAIPNKKVREFMAGKKVEQKGDRVGIGIGDEKDALWLDGKQFEDSDEGVQQAKEYIKDAKEKTGLLNKSNVVINDVIDILDALPDDAGVWEAIKSNYGWFTSAGGKNPLGMEPVMIDIKDKNGNVRKVNAFEILKQKMGALQDVYNRVNLARAALTSNVMDHWQAILGDPKSLNEWFTGQSLQTVKDKTESLKEFLNAGVTEQLVGSGFLREPLEKAYPTGSQKPLASQDTVYKQMRSNPEAFRSKVK